MRAAAGASTSTGRDLLTALEPAALDRWIAAQPLARLTPRTVTAPDALRALLDAVRRDGHCLASEAHEAGVMALAVPLRNMAGQTVAALNVVSAPARLQRAAARKSLLGLLGVLGVLGVLSVLGE